MTANEITAGLTKQELERRLMSIANWLNAGDGKRGVLLKDKECFPLSEVIVAPDTIGNWSINGSPSTQTSLWHLLMFASNTGGPNIAIFLTQDVDTLIRNRFLITK